MGAAPAMGGCADGSAEEGWGGTVRARGWRAWRRGAGAAADGAAGFPARGAGAAAQGAGEPLRGSPVLHAATVT